MNLSLKRKTVVVCTPKQGHLDVIKEAFKSGVIADGVRMGSCRVTTKRTRHVLKASQVPALWL